MNKAILALFLIILLILIIWNTIPYGYHFQQQIYNLEAVEKPLILISEQDSSLDSLEILLQDHSLIERIVIEKDSLITENLIKTYNLEKARSILTKYDLPDVMRIFFKAGEISFIAYSELEQLIKLKHSDLILRYDPNSLLQHDLKTKELQKIFYMFNIAAAIITLILLSFLRYHFEIKKNHFWKIFREAGGRHSHRNRQYWLNTLLLLTGPMLLIYGTYFVLSEYNLINFEIDRYLFMFQFTIILLSSFLSRIFLGDKN